MPALHILKTFRQVPFVVNKHFDREFSEPGIGEHDQKGRQSFLVLIKADVGNDLMGTSKRAKPERLAEKLLQIRKSLNLSQNEMLARLEHDDAHTRSNISAFERGIREPSLIILLSYARAAGVSVDILIDDKLDLPKNFLK